MDRPKLTLATESRAAREAHDPRLDINQAILQQKVLTLTEASAVKQARNHLVGIALLPDGQPYGDVSITDTGGESQSFERAAAITIDLQALPPRPAELMKGWLADPNQREFQRQVHDDIRGALEQHDLEVLFCGRTDVDSATQRTVVVSDPKFPGAVADWLF